MPRSRLLVCVLLALSCATAARGQSPAPGEGHLLDDEAPAIDVELTLRAYAVMPKFRFRDGVRGQAGSSIRTQEVGLDTWAPGVGGSAALWLAGSERFALDTWLLSASGSGGAPKDLVFGGEAIDAGTPMSTSYSLSYVAFEYLHRLQPTGWLWLDLGLRCEYLDFRVDVAGVGRASLEGAWPTVRIGFGVRPFAWLELEGRFGGFELTVPLTSTRVTQPYEVGGVARVLLPGSAFVEVGGLMQHVHLEEDPGEDAEDALHLRHRALLLALGLRF